MHFGDYTFIFLLALVLFGPKKLPEMGRQLGKLLAEFRRASNEFKFQIQEELRNMEDDERRKKQAEEQAAVAAPQAAELPAAQAAELAAGTPTIMPPSSGTPVSTSRPYATPLEAEPAPFDDYAPPGETEATVDPPPPAATAVPSEPAALPASPEPPLPGSTLPASMDLIEPVNGDHSPAPESLTHAGESVNHA